MQVKPLTVRAVAWTHFQPPVDVPWTPDTDGGQALVEFAGRACYQSWNKPNPITASNAGYVAHLLSVGHLSVLEHGTVTFYLTGVSRSFTHELVRHRHLSYSQLSQRYVTGAGDVVEPDVIAGHPRLHQVFTAAAEHAERAYQELLHWLERELVGSWENCRSPQDCLVPKQEHRDDPYRHLATHTRTLTRKAARQAARAVLPNATETKIVVTGNYRAWRHFLDMRASEHADVEIREVAIAVLQELFKVAPHVFADYTVHTLHDGTLAARSPHQEMS